MSNLAENFEEYPFGNKTLLNINRFITLINFYKAVC